MLTIKTELSDLKIKGSFSEKDLSKTDPIFSELLETRAVMQAENLSKTDGVQKNNTGIRDLEFLEGNNNVNTKEQPESKNYDWATIKDVPRVITILESYADEQKRSILNALAGKALNWKEIVKICNIPHTSCYRKIISLARSGLLIKEDVIIGKRKRINKYKRVIEGLRININNNRITIQAKIDKKLLEKNQADRDIFHEDSNYVHII